MAYYNEEDDEQGQGQGTGEGVGPTAVGPEAATLGATAAGAASAAAPGKADSFVGISDYINANKPQSEKLAGQVVGNIDQKAQAVDQSLGGLQSSFNQAADSQKVTADEDLLGQVKTNAEKVAADEAKSGSFAKLRDASYAGPQKLEDIDQGQAWAGLPSSLQKARGAKDAVNTEEGRMGLIKEISNNPRQSQGALTFDNLLLQSNPGAAAKLQAAGSNLNDIDQRLSGAQQSAAQKAAEVQAANAATSQQAKDALKAGYEGFAGSLNERVAAADAEQQTAFDELLKTLAQNQNSPSRLPLTQLGLNDPRFLGGMDLSKFVERADTADARTLATEDDYIRQEALQKLGGQFDPLLNAATDKELMGQVGKGYNVNSGALSGAIKENEGAYNREIEKIVGGGGGETGDWKQAALKYAAGLGPKPDDRSPGDQTWFDLESYVKKNKDKVQEIKETAQKFGVESTAPGTGIVRSGRMF